MICLLLFNSFFAHLELRYAFSISRIGP
jgi:hypothetical protein